MTPESASVSEDWQLAADDLKSPSLVVALRRSAHIFPWFRFAYAEGDNSLVKIAFATHMVTVSGHGLAALLADLAGQRVLRIIQPTENEAKFGVRGAGSMRQSGPGITDISVEAIQ
jgi:hypothetical protein